MKKAYILLCLMLLIPGNIFAYDNKVTHKSLTRNAIKKFGLNQYLINALDLPKGIETYLGERTILGWMQEGAQREDEPRCRASNHFHNPIIPNWLEAGVQDLPWYIKLLCELTLITKGNCSY